MGRPQLSLIRSVDAEWVSSLLPDGAILALERTGAIRFAVESGLV